jgi:ABC transporter substrate binding protein
MRRRDFIKAITVSAAWPLTARAQQTLKAAHIGFLAFRSPMSADELFFQGLRNFGWTEGQNILIERRFAGANANQLRGSAAELVRLKVDVIVAVASAGTLAAKDATTSIPIVFVNAGASRLGTDPVKRAEGLRRSGADPVGQGFVQSLAHPAAAIDKRKEKGHVDFELVRRDLLVDFAVEHIGEAAGHRDGDAGIALDEPIRASPLIETYRDPTRVHAICEEYRAAASLDIEHDKADQKAMSAAGPSHYQPIREADMTAERSPPPGWRGSAMELSLDVKPPGTSLEAPSSLWGSPQERSAPP